MGLTSQIKTLPKRKKEFFRKFLAPPLLGKKGMYEGTRANRKGEEMIETIDFQLNGKPARFTVDGERQLLWVLRTDLALTGTKYGCGKELCKACTVLLNQKAVRSCQIPVKEVKGQKVLTIEGLAPNGESSILFKKPSWNTMLCQNKITYAQLAKGKAIEKHLSPKPPLKAIWKFMVIGKDFPRKDRLEKVTGKAQYAGDIRLARDALCKNFKAAGSRGALKEHGPVCPERHQGDLRHCLFRISEDCLSLYSVRLGRSLFPMMEVGSSFDA